VPRSDRSSGWTQGLPARPPGPRTGDPYVCPGCARTYLRKDFFDHHVSLCVNESEPEEEPEDEPPEDEPEEQPEEQPEDEPRIVPFYDQSDRSSLAVPSHEALGSISPSLQAEVAAVEKFVTEHCAEIIAGITHGEAPMYEPVRAHAEALRNLERTSCLLVVSTVPAVYNCFIASELRPSAGIHLRSQLEARPAGLGGHGGRWRVGWGVTGVSSVWGRRGRAAAQAWLGYRWHGGRPRPRPCGGARLEITSQPVSAVGVGAVGGG
jgi:hypothetical protein